MFQVSFEREMLNESDSNSTQIMIAILLPLKSN